MEADYILLLDGRKVRMLFNMNAVEIFTRSSSKELTDLATIKSDVAIFRKLAFACAKEGEEADGRKLDIDEISFGRLMTVANMTEFSAIIQKQGLGAQKKSPPRPRRWWQGKRT